MVDYEAGLSGLTEDELRAKIVDLRRKFEVLASGKVVPPLAEDDVLVLFSSSPEMMKRSKDLVMAINNKARNAPLIVQIDNQIVDIMVCKKGQVCYTKKGRVIVNEDTGRKVEEGEEDSEDEDGKGSGTETG